MANGWGWGRLLFAAVLAVLSAIYLAAPDSGGAVAFFATAVVGLVSLAVGSLVHRPARKGPWRWLMASAGFFLLGLLVRLELFVFISPDLWAFVGYGCMVMGLVGLLRRTSAGPDRTLFLDTAAITTGAALVGWVMNVAPELTSDHPHLDTTLVNALYPVMDAAVLALIVQLAFRRGSSAPALQAAVASITALLIGDLGYTFVWAVHPGAVNPYLNVCYLVAYGYLGLMALHPSMRELSDVDVHRPATMSRSRLIVVFLAMLTPAAVPVMLPTHGRLDGAVRAVIMTAFAAVVFLRLLGTVQAHGRAEAEADHRATHDGLTGLPNRLALLDHLDAHLAPDRPTWVNLFFVNCDHFKRINDSWGHAAGDQVLIEVAARLRSMTSGPPGPGFLARVGGDEFVLRLDATGPGRAKAVAERIMALFEAPFVIDAGRNTLVTPSIGICEAPPGRNERAEDLIRNADLALNQAKSAGRATFVVHDPQMHERIIRRHALADALRGALDRSEIHVVFQPIRTGPGYTRLAGWEALVRWTHPDLGPISPVEFVPIAEDTGLIVDIGTFVLNRAAVQLRSWQVEFDRPDLHMSVNVSSVQLLRDDVAALVSHVLAETGLAPGDLWLEITESVVLERTDEAIDTLNGLADLGVKLCMDDFGTGYSSLAYLKDFTVHVLKVDRAFIRNLTGDQRDRELTKAMIDVARALNLRDVVAEGVETPEQAAVLEELGCSMVQGYLFGRPESPDRAGAEAAQVLAAGLTDHLASGRSGGGPA